jgi:hypothetical protein
MLTCSTSLVLLSSLMISCVVYLFGDLGFYHFEGFLFDSENFRGSSLFLCLGPVLSLTLLTAGRGHVGLLWHSSNGLSYNSSAL